MGAIRSQKNITAGNVLWIMETTIERMARLVDDLLAIARLNFSQEKIHKRQIALRALLEEAYDDCLVLAEQKGVLFHYESDDITLLGERDRLKEVILNLLSNSLKHTFSGGKILLTGKKKGSHAEITVRDSGAGITPENLPRIFERFYRISGGSSPGSGLGLHICKQIVEAHGGTITAESQIGKGSVFIVRLPLAVKKITSATDTDLVY